MLYEYAEYELGYDSGDRINQLKKIPGGHIGPAEKPSSLPDFQSEFPESHYRQRVYGRG